MSRHPAAECLAAKRPFLALIHLAADAAGLVRVRCRRRSCRTWWYESRKPRRPKLCAMCGHRAGVPWREG